MGLSSTKRSITIACTAGLRYPENYPLPDTELGTASLHGSKALEGRPRGPEIRSKIVATLDAAAPHELLARSLRDGAIKPRLVARAPHQVDSGLLDSLRQVRHLNHRKVSVGHRVANGAALKVASITRRLAVSVALTQRGNSLAVVVHHATVARAQGFYRLAQLLR